MNSPPTSTPSIASRMRGRSGSYCAFTSTSGIGRTAGKSRRPSPADDQIGGESENSRHDRVLSEAEIVMEALVALPGRVARPGDRKAPHRRTEQRQDGVAPERHPEDSRRNRDERTADRGHPPDPDGEVVPAIEPALGAVELGGAHVQPAPAPLQQRTAAVEADCPADDRAGEVTER